MKKILRTLFFLGVATALSACSDHEENDTTGPATDKLVSIHFTAINPDTNETPESRTAIDIDDQTKRFVSRWDDQDRMAMYYACGDAMDAVAATYDATAKKFTAQLPDLTGAWNYMTFAPYFDQPLKADGSGFQAPFGNHRTQTGNNFNYLFDPLVLKAPISTTDSAPGKDDQGNELTFDLARLTSILKYEIRGGSDAIKALLLTADKTISSSYYYGSFDGTGSYALNNANEDPVESNVIAVTFEGAAPTAAELDAYFNLPPARYGSLQLDIITANNTMGTLTLTDPASADGGFVAGELYRLKANAPSFAAVAAPSFEWKDAQGGNMDLNAPHEITVENGSLTYPADIQIYAPAGIATLTVGVESDVLTPIVSLLDLINSTNIPNPADPAGAPLASFQELGLSYGKAVEFHKSTSFNIGNLVPMIMIYAPAVGTEHIFRVTVTDLAGNTTVQPITFTVPAPVVEPSITRGTPNAWTNSVDFTLNDVPASAQEVKVQYKTTSETEWHDAELNADRTVATAKPEWVSYTTADWTTLNANIQPYYRLKPKTGIIKGNRYQYRMIIDGTEYSGNPFNAPTTVNPAIETLDNDALSCYIQKNEDAVWWASGNNSNATALCTYYYNDVDMLGYALLKAKSGVMVVGMAPGNLFTGTFQGPSGFNFNGTVSFGKPYDWQVRPKAVKVKYDAKILDVDNKYHGEYIKSGTQDYARIFVAIVDWANPRKVTSGLSSPKGMWDPETAVETPDAANFGGGKIIGYASTWISQRELTGGLQTFEIPMNYYDTQTNPASSAYSIVISCATSAYGDFLNGGTGNELYIGDFEWVY